MTEFTARPRTPPKSEYWLGCIVKEITGGIAYLSGNPYARISFDNCPYFATVGMAWVSMVGVTLRERECFEQALPVPGDTVHLDVRWRVIPSGGTHIIVPDVRIDMRQLVEDKVLLAALLRQGRTF